MTQWEMHVAHSQRAFPGSSCFDLRGIRAELARALLQEGHLPWISEEQQFEYLQSGTLPFGVETGYAMSIAKNWLG